MVEPLCELATRRTAGIDQPAKAAITALASIAPCLRTSKPLISCIAIPSSRRHLQRHASEALPSFLLWIARLVTEKQLTEVLESILLSPDFEDDAVEDALGHLLFRLPQRSEVVLGALEQDDRLDLVSRLSPRDTTPSDAVAAFEALVRYRASHTQTVSGPRYPPSPNGRAVELWSSKQQEAVISHLIESSIDGREMVATRDNVLRTAAHVARWASLPQRQSATLSARTLEIGSMDIYSPLSRSEMKSPLSNASLGLATALQPSNKPCNPELAEELMRRFLTRDEMSIRSAANALNELGHKGVFPISLKVLAVHPNSNIRAVAALQLAGGTEFDEVVAEALAADEAIQVRSVLARHTAQLRSRGAVGEQIAEHLEQDREASIRWFAKTLHGRCPHHE